jgi:hypothetical protein
MKKFALLIIACLTILAACKKDDADPSKKELLCGKNWKMTALTINATGVTIDVFALYYEDCDKDDLVRFNEDGTTLMDYKVRCDPSDPATETGTWSFNSDQTVLTMDGDAYNIVELTGSTLKVTANENIDGENYLATITFKPSN